LHSILICELLTLSCGNHLFTGAMASPHQEEQP
jgi:hypothetical protein